MKVEWTDRAKKDLRKLFDYYKDDAQNVVAKSVTNHIVRQSMLLESLPLLGLVEPSLEGKKIEYRSLILGNQKIIYWIDGETVFIATLFDCRQDPLKLWNRVV
jgi:toxin ParE1/3/4